jgi:2-polyprenyl-6-methoxyphenol hydroxylase-like FAD-dependent oxidoreductase
MHADVDRWLEELDRTPAFYFDSITQVRMDTWSRGRVTRVGDAGHCPGPAVGGSAGLGVMAEHVRGSRAAALSAAKTLIPTSRLGVQGLTKGRAPARPRPLSHRLQGSRTDCSRCAGAEVGV